MQFENVFSRQTNNITSQMSKFCLYFIVFMVVRITFIYNQMFEFYKGGLNFQNITRLFDQAIGF